MIQKDEYIRIFRNHGFNCFPIPKYPKSYLRPKGADSRYDAEKTVENQIITDNENYGIISLPDSGTCIIDFDNKEMFRKFAEENISNGWMVIETPHGWHIPVQGLSGNIQKTKLYNYQFQPNKQIIEIQDSKHYVIGVGCELYDPKEESYVKYENRGSTKIFDAKKKNFNDFIDFLCKTCNVESQKRSSRSSYLNMRERFKSGLVPTTGTSNDYFFNAALQCNTDGLSRLQAVEKIKEVYTKWQQSETFSNRPWNNIEAKINDVYDNDRKLVEGRPPKGKTKDDIDRSKIVSDLLNERKIFYEKKTETLFENKNGFLEELKRYLDHELLQSFPNLSRSDYDDILFKLHKAPEPPPTNRDLIVFKNGIYDKISRQLLDSDDVDEIADMGFKDYNYLPCHEENHPKEFMRIMFENIPKNEYRRVNAGLKSSIDSYLDPRISVIHGSSGVGKSTPLTILAHVLGDQYALTVELNQFLEDKFIRANIMNKRLVIFQDLPKNWKDFSIIKTATGEEKKTERGFHKDMVTFENKIKIWASGNYLAKIPKEEQDPMYARRLSLVHNTRKTAQKENSKLVQDVVKNEGEKIISWILNIPDNECEYEDKATIQAEWENIASPEIQYLKEFWRMSDIDSDYSVAKIITAFRHETKLDIDFEQMIKSLKSLGYPVRNNIVISIEPIPKQKLKGALDENKG